MKIIRFAFLVGVFVFLSGCANNVQKGQKTGSTHTEDLLIADFEGEGYIDWKVNGTAFGKNPRWRDVEFLESLGGFEGKGLATSYHNGDDRTGTLTSPEFRIKRNHIVFLIAGGDDQERISMNLIVDDRVVRQATGNKNNLLDWESWDVEELKGKTGMIRLVDNHKRGWGHVSVDHIYQSNKPGKYMEKKQKIKITKRYVNFPVNHKARKKLVSLIINNEVVREFDISLANKEPEFWVFLEVEKFKGADAILKIDKINPEKSEGFDAIFQADTFPGEDNVYNEKLRPQFHFTSKRGWNNDTNGLVYYDGEYHMFYQHNPFGWPWGNMTWGHAISTDMIHWTEVGDAIHPDELGTIFSGGAVVDHNNTSGFQTGNEKPIVCFYTSAGGTNAWSDDAPFTQSIAYSNDRGRTFTKYEGNPIIGHIRGGNRDPKVIWHEPTRKWVMVLYVEEKDMDFFTSTDLKNWTKTSRLKSFHECPELFKLPVDSDENNKKWVLYGAAADYLIGSFDGKKFKPETDKIKFDNGSAFYASQTFSDIPKEDGRRVMMGWGQVPMPGMPWNQMISFPIVLSLRTTDEGIRMFAEPAKEVQNLHKKKHSFSDMKIDGDKTLPGINGELFHIKAEFEVQDAESFGLIISEFKISYDRQSARLICLGPKNDVGPDHFSEPREVSLKPVNGKIILEVLVDRTMVEVFPNNGRYYMPMGTYLVDKDPSIKVFSEKGNTKLVNLEIYELKSIWQ